MPTTTIAEHNPDVVELPRVFEAPHEALHPGQIEYEKFGNNGALKQASDALSYSWDEGQRINELRANPDPEHRAAKHDRLVGEACDNFDDSRARKFESAKAKLKSEIAHVETLLEIDAQLRVKPEYITAVTGAFYSMKPGERIEELNRLIEQGSGSTLAILIEADPFLTGLTVEQRSSIRPRAYEKANPKQFALLQQLKRSFDKMERASIEGIKMAAGLRAGTHDGAWRERAKKAAAANASSNLANRKVKA